MNKNTTPLTEQEIGKYVRAFSMVWDEIASDYLEACGESYVSQLDVWEAVTDADRAETSGYITHEEMQRFYRTVTKEEKQAICAKAFPYKSYGF